MTKSAEILEFLREQGPPSRLPEAWGPLPCDPALFDLLEDREELLRQLLERFTLRELLRARVVQTDTDGRVALSGFLTTNDSYLCALQKPRAKKPFDVVVGGGGTLLGQLPVTAALDDADISARVEREGGRLFLAQSAANVAIFRSLGWPAVPSHAVEHLGGKGLELFCTKMGLPLIGCQASDAATAPPNSGRKRGQATGPRIPRSLILVNWQPSQLTLADDPKMLEIRNHLLALAERLGIPLDDFAIWKPSVAWLARLRHALECGDPALVRAVVLAGFEDDCVMLDRWPLIEPQEPRTLVEAVSALHAPQDRLDRRTAPQDRQLLERLLHRDLIESILKPDDETTGPLERNLRVTLAELSRVFHLGAWQPAVGSVALRERLAAAKQILAITKELRS
jgi:hypothetical protein